MTVKEEILKPGTILYHGTKKKIPFDTLGFIENNIEPYGFSTKSFNKAKIYSGPSGSVLCWTPKKELKILVLNKKSLQNILDWVRQTYGESKINDKVYTRIMTKELSLRSRKTIDVNKKIKYAVKKNPLLSKVSKSMKPYEFFGYGMRYDGNSAKTLRKGKISESNLHKPGILKATTFHCMSTNYLKYNRPKLTKNTVCSPISLTNTGYLRSSFISFDVGMYHYIFKFLKQKTKYNGIKMVTRGFHSNNNNFTNDRYEYVIYSGALKKVPCNSSIKQN